MKFSLKKFAECERGNVAIIAAAAALPLLALVGGVIDLSNFTNTRSNIQNAADNAVLAAFHNPRESWSQREKRVNQIFKANITNKQDLKPTRVLLDYHLEGKATVMTYTVQSGLNSLFGELSPFVAQEFEIRSTAKFDPKTRRRPHLVANPPKPPADRKETASVTTKRWKTVLPVNQTSTTKTRRREQEEERLRRRRQKEHLQGD